jgi:hypothetical protein
VKRFTSWLIVSLFVIGVVLLLIAHAAFLQHWIGVRSGTDYLMCGKTPCPNQEYYNWWSGPGSDLGEIAILGGVIALYRKHNCHVTGCWRIARHTVEGTPYIVCRRHHPGIAKHVGDGPITAEHIADAHAAAAVQK